MYFKLTMPLIFYPFSYLVSWYICDTQKQTGYQFNTFWSTVWLNIFSTHNYKYTVFGLYYYSGTLAVTKLSY